MSSQLPIRLSVLFALIFSLNVFAARAQQKSPTSDQRQVVDTVSTIFSAVGAEDIAKFDCVIAPDFYIFANGTRFNGDAIMDAIKAQHAAGKKYEEHVTNPDVHISGNVAWIAYVNQGSITDASCTGNQNWLESAFLEKQSGKWKNPLHAQHPRPHADSREPTQMTSKLQATALSVRFDVLVYAE